MKIEQVNELYNDLQSIDHQSAYELLTVYIDDADLPGRPTTAYWVTEEWDSLRGYEFQLSRLRSQAHRFPPGFVTTALVCSMFKTNPEITLRGYSITYMQEKGVIHSLV